MRLFVFLCLFMSLHCHAQSNADSLRKYVVKLSELPFPRNAAHIESLNRAAQYIKEHFSRYTPRVFYQKYEIDKVLLKNVIASVGPDTGYRIIVGANYDVFGNTPGADANASGVAALLELSRLLSRIKNLPYRVDLVAYTMGDSESLPAAQTGSYMHAKSLKDNHVKVLGALCMHGIGFYTDVPNTQKYPYPYYRYLYGNRGNFISLYLQSKSEFFPMQIKRYFKQYKSGIKVVSFKPIIKFNKLAKGDQENYWNMGFAAVRISNTNAYRNKYYHYDVDTYETLDYKKMAAVVNMMFETLMRYKQ